MGDDREYAYRLGYALGNLAWRITELFGQRHGTIGLVVAESRVLCLGDEIGERLGLKPRARIKGFASIGSVRVRLQMCHLREIYRPVKKQVLSFESLEEAVCRLELEKSAKRLALVCCENFGEVEPIPAFRSLHANYSLVDAKHVRPEHLSEMLRRNGTRVYP